MWRLWLGTIDRVGKRAFFWQLGMQNFKTNAVKDQIVVKKVARPSATDGDCDTAAA